MYTASRQFRFCASHQLDLPYESPCNRYHRHYYLVELHLACRQLNAEGMVLDFDDTTGFEEYIQSYLDYQNLNLILPYPTTAENIARHLYGVAWKLWDHLDITIRLSPKPKIWVSYDGKV